MTELEKLDAGLEYDFWDEEVNARKLHAVKGCEKLNKTDMEVLFRSTVELDQFIGELQRFGRTKTLIVFSTSVEHRGIHVL